MKHVKESHLPAPFDPTGENFSWKRELILFISLPPSNVKLHGHNTAARHKGNYVTQSERAKEVTSRENKALGRGEMSSRRCQLTHYLQSWDLLHLVLVHLKHKHCTVGAQCLLPHHGKSIPTTRSPVHYKATGGSQLQIQNLWCDLMGESWRAAAFFDYAVNGRGW